MAKKTVDRPSKLPFPANAAAQMSVYGAGEEGEVRKEKARQFTKAYDEALKQILYFAFCRSGLNTQFNFKATIDIYGMDDWSPAIVALAPYRRLAGEPHPQNDFCLNSDQFLKNFCVVVSSLTEDRDDITPVYHEPTQSHHVMIQSPEAGVDLLERLIRFANLRTQDHVPVYLRPVDQITPLERHVELMEEGAVHQSRLPLEAIRTGQNLYRPVAIYSGKAQSDFDAEQARRNPPDVQISIERLRAMAEQMRGLEGKNATHPGRSAEDKSPISGLYYTH